MSRSLRRTASALAVALTAVVATTVGATPAHADDPQPILPFPPFATPTPTPAPTTPAAPATPAKPSSSPSKQATPKPTKQKTTKHTSVKSKAHTKKKAKSPANASTPRSETTSTLTVVSPPVAGSTRARSVTPSKAKAASPAKQVAAPNFLPTTPRSSVAATPEAAPAAPADLLSSPTSSTSSTGSPLSLWVPVGLLGFLVVLIAGTLRHRRRTGGV